MDREEELQRMIEDRDEAEAEAEYLYDELNELDELDNEDEYNRLHRYICDLENHARYLTHCIDNIMGPE